MTAHKPAYRKIALTRGYVTLIDCEDWKKALHISWHVGLTNSGYARAEAGVAHGGKRKILRLARFLMGVDFGDPRIVDHINGDALDNRRANLRICTKAQNNLNRGPNKSNNGHKGVTWRSDKRKWEVRISVKRKVYRLGYFTDFDEACAAYREVAPKYHGEFTRFE